MMSRNLFALLLLAASMTMGFFDIFLFLLYTIGLYAVAQTYANTKLASQPDLYSYFMPAFRLKMLGCIGFIGIYLFYYKDGDTFAYFHWSEEMIKYFFRNPADGFRFFLFSDDELVFNKFYFNAPPSRYFYLMHFQSAEVTFCKIGAAVSIMGLRSYLSSSLLFTTISFYGLWKLFRVFYDINPRLARQFSWAIMYVPSVLFWGSGMMKDTVTLAGTGIITYNLYFGIIKRKNLIGNVIMMILVGYFVAKIKGYILLAFFPSATLWVFLVYREKIRSSFLRIAFLPIFIGLSALVIYFVYQGISSDLGAYSIENLQSRAEGFQKWHQIASGDEGSGYTLGTEGDFSLRTMLLKLPLALNVTFFRPYLWQANSVVMLMAAIESSLLFAFFLYILLIGRWKVVRSILKDPNIQFALIFSLVFGFAVGFTSYNFGALVRYKIPCIPFFICALMMIYDRVKMPAIQTGAGVSGQRE